jgi:hypothetical protein
MNAAAVERERAACFISGVTGIDLSPSSVLRRRTRSGIISIESAGIDEYSGRKSADPCPDKKNPPMKKNLNEQNRTTAAVQR